MWRLLDLPAHFERLAARLRPWRLWVDLTAWISSAAMAAVAIWLQPKVITRGSGALFVAMIALCLSSWWAMMGGRMFESGDRRSFAFRNPFARWYAAIFLTLFGVVSVVLVWKVGWLFGLL